MILSKKAVGRIISKYRNLKGYTQAQLADILDISIGQIQKYEYGVNYPSLETLDKIIRELELPSETFFNDAKVKDLINRVDKRYLKYNKINQELDKDNKIVSFLMYYFKNKANLKNLDHLKIAQEFSKLPDKKKKTAASLISKTIRSLR